MKLEIVNLSKFIRSIIIIFIILLGSMFIITNKSLSHTDTSYKTICVTNGDTLWSIARDEKETNLYYSDKDVRDIVDNIKTTNHLTVSNLSINQELKIPII